MFDPQLLRSFVAVADCGNFTRAAERLHLTQSTVSQQVRRLEEDAGCRLLDRSQRRVVATVEGERLLGYARRILALQEEARDALGDLGSAGVLRLGVPEDFAAERLMPLLAAFAANHPGTRLEVTSGLGPDLRRAWQGGEFDLLLVKQMGESDDCLASWPEPMAWFDSHHNPALGREPLPLVAFPAGGLYRNGCSTASTCRAAAGASPTPAPASPASAPPSPPASASASCPCASPPTSTAYSTPTAACPTSRAYAWPSTAAKARAAPAGSWKSA